MAELTNEQMAEADKIRELRQAEAVVRREAEAEARQLVRDRVAAAQNATNARIGYAHYTLGMNKTQIAKYGFNTTDRRQIYERLATVERPNMTAVDNSRLIVNRVAVNQDGDLFEVIIRMDGFNHPDLGQDLSGTITFAESGNVLTTEASSDSFATAILNPIWPMILWGLSTVQGQL